MTRRRILPVLYIWAFILVLVLALVSAQICLPYLIHSNTDIAIMAEEGNETTSSNSIEELNFLVDFKMSRPILFGTRNRSFLEYLSRRYSKPFLSVFITPPDFLF